MDKKDPFAAQSGATDPFAQAGNTGPAGDPFDQAPSSDGIRAADLIGEVVLFRVDNCKVEEVDRPTEYGGGKQDRLTVDVAILTGKHAGEVETGMWIFNPPIIRDIVKAKANGIRCVLSRPVEIPSKIEKAKKGGAQSREDLEKAYAEFRAGTRRDKPNVAYILDPHTDADKQTAREFLAGNSSFLR